MRGILIPRYAHLERKKQNIKTSQERENSRLGHSALQDKDEQHDKGEVVVFKNRIDLTLLVLVVYLKKSHEKPFISEVREG